MSTARLLTQMDEIVRKANAKVLLNPFDAPAAVMSSNEVRNGVVEFRGRLGIESGAGTGEAKRWGQAAAEIRDKAISSASAGVSAASRAGSHTLARATEAFRAVDIDGDGVPSTSPGPPQPRRRRASDQGCSNRSRQRNYGTPCSSAVQASGVLARRSLSPMRRQVNLQILLLVLAIAGRLRPSTCNASSMVVAGAAPGVEDVDIL